MSPTSYQTALPRVDCKSDGNALSQDCQAVVACAAEICPNEAHYHHVSRHHLSRQYLRALIDGADLVDFAPRASLLKLGLEPSVNNLLTQF